jgi:hypothetical protein
MMPIRMRFQASVPSGADQLERIGGWRIRRGTRRRLRPCQTLSVPAVLPDDLQPEARQQGEEPGIRVQHAEAGIDADR